MTELPFRMPRAAPAHRLSGFALGLDLARVPQEVIRRACLHVLDALGVALAATDYAFAENQRAAIAALAGRGDQPVIGWPDRLPMRDAAWLNGTLIRGLDYDDCHLGSGVHVSASALPAVLAAGLAAGASGGQALAAYLVAAEVDARLGAVEGGFRRRGFDPTGVVGAFGATLAAGRLWGLDFQALNAAQGIVLGLASGTRQGFDGGAATGATQAGWAASCALHAAALARGGMLGPAQPYEGQHGLYRSHLGLDAGDALGERLESLGADWELPRIALKHYPARQAVQAVVEAALELRQVHALSAADIDRVVVRVHPQQGSQLCEPAAAKRRPRSAHEARGSLQFLLAASLVCGRLTLAEFESSVLTDPVVLALAERCEHAAATDDDADWVSAGCELSILTRDGRRLVHHLPHAGRADRQALSPARIISKFEANAARIMPTAALRELRDRVLELPRLPSLALLAEAFTAEA